MSHRTFVRTMAMGSLVLTAWLTSAGLPAICHADTKVIVRFAPGVISFPGLDRGFGSSFVAGPQDAQYGLVALGGALQEFNIRSFATIAPWFRHLSMPQHDRFGNTVQLVDTANDYLVTFNGNFNLDALLGELNALPGVTIAEPAPNESFYFTPNDPHYGLQWYLNNSGGAFNIYDPTHCGPDSNCVADIDINAPQAWDSISTPGTHIGLIDTGVNSSHEDMRNVVNLFLSDCSTDPCGHGSAVAGIMLANGNNDKGVAGVANPKSQTDTALVVLSAVGGDCESVDSDKALSALSTFANNSNYYPHVLTVNESFGGSCRKWDYSTEERDVHRNAYLKGLSVVTAAGNVVGCWDEQTDSCVVYPAAYNRLVLAVTGTDCKGNNQWAQGSWVDLCAPSDEIVTIKNGGGYQGVYPDTAHCGTSLSTPVVTASAAMLLGVNSSLGPDDIAAILERTAKDLGDTGRDDVYGYGLVRLDAAVNYISRPHILHTGTTSSFTATLVDQREEEFRCVPGVNDTSQTWVTRLVKVYEVDISADFSLGQNEEIVDAWARPRLSTGFPNESKIDARTFTGCLGVVPGSVTSTGCTLRTYTYKIYATEDSSRCDRWYPFSVPGQGLCGFSTQVPRFDYAYVGTTGSPRPGRPAGGAIIRSMVTGSGVILSASGATESNARFEVFDVAGRLVWSGLAGRGTDGRMTAFWPTRTPGIRRTHSGMYFAVLRAGGRTLSGRKIVVLQ